MATPPPLTPHTLSLHHRQHSLPLAQRKLDVLLDTLDKAGDTPVDPRSMFTAFAVDISQHALLRKDRSQVEEWCEQVKEALASGPAADGVSPEMGQYERASALAMYEIFVRQMAMHPARMVGGAGRGRGGSGQWQ